MNPIKRVFESITNAQLSTAIQEIAQDEPIGTIRNNGQVRIVANRIKEITGQFDLTLAQNSLLKEAAYRWAYIH